MGELAGDPLACFRARKRPGCYLRPVCMKYVLPPEQVALSARLHCYHLAKEKEKIAPKGTASMSARKFPMARCVKTRRRAHLSIRK